MQLTFLRLLPFALLCVPAHAQQVLQSWVPAAGEVPRSIATAGDVDGDGLEDLAIVETDPALASSRLRVVSLASPTALLDIVGVPDVPDVGSALLALRDIDGDGHGDVVVGGRGRIEAYSGADGHVLWTCAVVGDTRSVALVSDFDADGQPDLLVGIPRAPGPVAGGALVISAASGAVLRTIVAPAGASSTFGCAVALADDRDGDGVGDFLIGDYGAASNRGAVHFVSASTTQVLTTLAGAPGTVLYGFGYDVAFLEDLDGDGFGELAVAAPWSCQGGGYEGCGASGRIHILSGASLAELRRIDTFGALSFGLSVERFADLDGDGVDELLVASGSMRFGCCNFGPGSTYLVSPRTGQLLGQGFGQSSGMATRVPDLDGDGFPEYLSAVSLFGNVRTELSLTRVQPFANLACTSRPNSAGCVPTLTAYGTPSLAAAGDLDFALIGTVAGRASQVAWSLETANRNLRFGTLCISSPFKTSPVLSTVPDPFVPCGSYATFRLPNSELLTLGAPGSRFHAQAFQRDPTAGGVSLSTSVVVTIWP